jgi:hypothetical protein
MATSLNLFDRLRNASERAQILSVLGDARLFVDSVGVNVLTNSEYATMISILIDSTTPTFIGSLTKSEYELLFLPLFSGPIVDVFLGVIQSLDHNRLSMNQVEKLLALIDYLFERRLNALFIAATVPMNEGSV